MKKMVSTEVDNNILNITLTRPEVRNAFGPQLIQELSEIFEQSEMQDRCNSKEIIACVLRGEGTSFCAGADLDWMKSMANMPEEENRQDANRLFQMFMQMWSCPVPLLAIAQGHVMGGGVGLLSVCDMVAIEENTKLGLTEVKIGLVPAVISPFVLEKISRSEAYRWMLTGEFFTAQQALNMGLAQFTGTLDASEKFIQQQVHALRACGPEAVKKTKQILKAQTREQIEKHRSFLVSMIAQKRVGPEGQEGLNSFFEKRMPAWRKQNTHE